jgi:hypothetical protein
MPKRIKKELPVEGQKTDLLEMLLTGQDKESKTEKKILALTFLEAYQRYYDGKWLPNFNEVEELLGIPRSTLHSWWQNKEQILRLQSTVLDTIPSIVASKLAVETLRLVQNIALTGYEGMENRDKINLLNTFVTKLRLLTGRSTANVDHKVSGYNPVLPSEPEQNSPKPADKQVVKTVIDG